MFKETRNNLEIFEKQLNFVFTVLFPGWVNPYAPRYPPQESPDRDEPAGRRDKPEAPRFRPGGAPVPPA